MIFVLGAGLRLYGLGKYNLWYDEVFSLFEVMFNFNRIIGYHFWTTPPLFKFLLYFWKFLGKSEFILRLLPALFGIFSVLIIYQVGKTLFDKRTGLISALLLSISPFHIYYSQELRAYTLVVFLALLSSYYLHSLLKKNQLLSWICFVIFTTLCLYSNNIAVFLLVAENLFFFIFYGMGKYKTLSQPLKLHKEVLNLPTKLADEVSCRKCGDLAIKWLTAQFIIFFLYIPTLIIIINQIIDKQIFEIFFWVPKPSILTFIHTFNIFNLGYNNTKAAYLSALFIFSLLFLYGVWTGKKETKSIALLIVCLFTPIILIIIISLILKRNSIYLYKIFLFVLPAYLIIVANGLSKIKKYIAYPSLVCIIFFSFLSLYNYYRDFFPIPVTPSLQKYRPGVFEKKEIKPAAQFIKRNFKNGDGIAHTCRSTYGPFMFYNQRKFDERWVIDNSNEDWKHWGKIYHQHKIIRKTFNLSPVTIEGYVKGKKRVWLVLAGWASSADIDSPGIKEWIDNNYILLDSKKFKGLEVYLYDLINRKIPVKIDAN